LECAKHVCACTLRRGELPPRCPPYQYDTQRATTWKSKVCALWCTAISGRGLGAPRGVRPRQPHRGVFRGACCCLCNSVNHTTHRSEAALAIPVLREANLLQPRLDAVLAMLLTHPDVSGLMPKLLSVSSLQGVAVLLSSFEQLWGVTEEQPLHCACLHARWGECRAESPLPLRCATRCVATCLGGGSGSAHAPTKGAVFFSGATRDNLI
jgi:hypothetical protein